LIRKFLLPGAVALTLTGCAANVTRPHYYERSAPPHYDEWSAQQKCQNGYTFYCPNASDMPLQPATGSAAASPIMDGHSEIALHGAGGTYTVPVSINGAITLDFTLDTGASDVSIPADVVHTLIRTGTIEQNDLLGSQTYVQADGSTAPKLTFRIRSLRVGDREVRNVTGSIAPEKGVLLLGQSFLRKFGSWSIDNRRGVLVLD
jgi:clan AA aspartic protease (TIGR02281 family)